MAGAGAAAATMAGLPLQWPLVGRHAELELFAATLADPRAHGFVIHGAPGVGKTRLADQCLAAGRPGRTRPSPGPPRPRARVRAPLGALAHLLPAGIGDDRCDLVAVDARGPAGARGSRPRTVRSCCSSTTSTTSTARRRRWSASWSTPISSSSSRPCGRRGRARRPGVAVAPGPRAPHRSRRPRPLVARHAAPPRPRAARSRRAPSPSSGRPARATSCSSESWSSPRSTSGHLVDQRGVWRLVGPLVTTARLHELVGARLGTVEAVGRRGARPARRVGADRLVDPRGDRRPGAARAPRSFRSADGSNRRTPPAGDARASRCTARSCGPACRR